MMIRSLKDFPTLMAVAMVLAMAAALVLASRMADAGTVINVIDRCVAAQAGKGGDGLACVGRVVDPCRKAPDNQSAEEQIECFQSEFVEWHLMLRREYAALRTALDTPDKQAKLKAAQDRWTAFHKADCRVPYAIFSTARAAYSGPDCSIRRTILFAVASWMQRRSAS